MRQANWDDLFQKKGEASPADERLSSVIPWEEWLTFGIVTMIFLACVSSIQSADWVDDMPSMYPIGFAGLVMGYAFSRIRRSELLIHPVALLIGAGLVYLQLLVIIPGGSIIDRTNQLVDRMQVWWTAVTQDGISNDGLPFITLLLILTWLGAYISAWAIFRWRNVWLGLVPSGFALLWNISFIPGQFSYAFVIFCFGAVLLVMRVHLQQKQDGWEKEGIKYPEFMSLSVLHATFWVAVVLLVLVWLVPLAKRSDTAQERWEDFTSPMTQYFTPYARVFVSVNAKKPINVHNIKDALPFQGKITLTEKDAVTIDVELTPEMAQFLREQSFDEYTAAGWKINVNGVPLAPGESTFADEVSQGGESFPDGAPIPGARQEVTINVTIKGGNDEHLYSVGQPLTSSEAAEARIGQDLPDVSSLEPAENLSNDDTYTVTGSVAVASIEQLLNAGDQYPSWVTERYLQLPDALPDRVGRKAEEVTAGADNPFDEAVMIERYLRTFPTDYDVPSTPAGRDTIDYFLFDLQRGYFDYHASAMAVMLRTLGVPARVATGYVVDPFAKDTAEDTTYELTQKNAYAWPEVYFPGIGWVEFSPSPAQPTIKRRIENPEPTPVAQADPNERGLGDEVDLGAIAPSIGEETVDETGGSSSDGLPLLIILGVIAAIIIALAAAGKFAWEYGLSGLSEPAKLWEKTVRLATLGRMKPEPSETPREFAARLRRDVPGAGAAGFVAAQYENDRFGHKDGSEDDAERLESAWSSLRGALMRRILRLKPASPST